LETTPKNATHWSTRSMAEHLGMSQSTVSRVWRAFGLAPHKQDSWKLSKDPMFTEKVRDVVGLYMNPPERALVLCV
ncbi:IS630 family transposase, partial [Gordonia paraffinivorans]